MGEDEAGDYFWLGAFSFGLVIGWVTATVFHRSEHGITEIAVIVGAIGGAAISKIVTEDKRAFGNYCLGLGGAFFFRIFLFWLQAKGYLGKLL